MAPVCQPCPLITATVEQLERKESVPGGQARLRQVFIIVCGGTLLREKHNGHRNAIAIKKQYFVMFYSPSPPWKKSLGIADIRKTETDFNMRERCGSSGVA